MQNLKMKMIFLVGIVVLISLLGVSVYASNENIQIIKESDSEYLIYVKDNLNNVFDFAFSNDKNADKDLLTYLSAAQDLTEEANYIAYINQYTIEDDYIWIKKADNTYPVEGVELDLAKAIPVAELTSIQDITKKIAVDTAGVQKEEKIIDGSNVVITTGKIIITEDGNYKYQISKVLDNSREAKLMDLAERISKFGNSTDMYTKLTIYNEFNNLYKEMSSELVDINWKNVENKEILQPEDTVDGDKYIVWLKNENNVLDAQFMTSTYAKEIKPVEITTKLPVTYDNNILLIVLGIVVIAIVIVSVRIKSLKKKTTN